VLAVAHEKFSNIDISGMKNPKTIVYDVKGILPDELVDERL
jgi:UDP-N-acetyl-D-galactosamine dehydrogenase